MNRQTFGNNRVRGIILSFAFAIVLCGVTKVKWYDVTRNKVNKPRSHSTRYPPPVNKVSLSYEYLRQTLRKTRQINSILPLLSLQLTQLLRIHATHVNIQSICTKFLITLYTRNTPGNMTSSYCGRYKEQFLWISIYRYKLNKSGAGGWIIYCSSYYRVQLPFSLSK